MLDYNTNHTRRRPTLKIYDYQRHATVFIEYTEEIPNLNQNVFEILRKTN